MNKKKLIGTIAIGGLILSAPLAAFAYKGGFDTEDRFNSINEIVADEDHIEFMKQSIELQIDQANTLIEQLDDTSDEQKEELELIIKEYAELEEFLESVDINEATADELRDAFFEVRETQHDLSHQIRDIIQSSFTIEERIALRTELQTQMDALREEYGIENLGHMRDEFNRGEPRMMMPFTIDELALIDEEIAQSYEDGSITLRVALDMAKEKLDAMDDDAREELLSQIRTNHLTEMLEEINETYAQQFANGELSEDDALNLIRENHINEFGSARSDFHRGGHKDQGMGMIN